MEASAVHFLQWLCMDVRVGPERRLSTKEWMFSNCGAGEDLRVPWTAEIKPVNSKGSQPLIFIGRTDAETEALILQPPDGKS